MDYSKNSNNKFTFGLFSRMLLSLFILLVISLSIFSISLLNNAEKQFVDFRLQHVQAQTKTLSDGSLDALITQDYELLERFVNSSLPPNNGAFAYFTRPNGLVLTSTDTNLTGTKITLPVMQGDKFTHATTYKGRPIVEVIYKSKVSTTHIANTHIGFYTDKNSFNHLKDAGTMVVTLILLFLVMIIGTYIIIAKIRTPILNLIRTVENTSYDMPIQLPKLMNQRNDEVGTLARVFEDVFTQLIFANKNISLAHNEALKALQIKSEFLQTMSHELRTPLHAITGYESLLYDTELNETQSKYCKNIKIGATQLLDIINEILDFSGLESNEIEIEYQPYSIITSLKEIYDSTVNNENLKNIEITYFVETAVPELIYTDVKRVRGVIVNIINNAVKFTEQGSIKINVTLSQAESTPQQILISITDTGIGIAEIEFDKIFEPFYQVDSSTTRKQGGLGLGLSLSRETIRQIGGDIRIESLLGKGSCFTISIPFKTKEDISQN